MTPTSRFTGQVHYDLRAESLRVMITRTKAAPLQIRSTDLYESHSRHLDLNAKTTQNIIRELLTLRRLFECGVAALQVRRSQFFQNVKTTLKKFWV